MKLLSVIFILMTWVFSQEYKAVFDCSSNNFNFLQSRIALIEKTASMIQKKGDTANFVLLIHSGCTPIAAMIADSMVKPKEAEYVSNIQSKLQLLHNKYKVDIRLCELAMNNAEMEKDEVLDFITFTPNSFIDAISLQNKGFAMMSFK